MRSITFYLCFIPVLALLLLVLNLIFAPHSPYQEKSSIFECGFHSFMGQNRTQFSISFFIYALLFLLFDIELFVIYPYVVSSPANETYGFVIMIMFFFILTIGFAFELGKKALNIDTKQARIHNIQTNKLVLQSWPIVPFLYNRYSYSYRTVLPHISIAELLLTILSTILVMIFSIITILIVYSLWKRMLALANGFPTQVKTRCPDLYSFAIEKPFSLIWVVVCNILFLLPFGYCLGLYTTLGLFVLLSYYYFFALRISLH